MDVKKIIKALYIACEALDFRTGFSNDQYDASVCFPRSNNKSTWVSYSFIRKEWEFSYLNQEEVVREKIEEAEAIDLIEKGFQEFGGEFNVSTA